MIPWTLASTRTPVRSLARFLYFKVKTQERLKTVKTIKSYCNVAPAHFSWSSWSNTLSHYLLALKIESRSHQDNSLGSLLILHHVLSTCCLLSFLSSSPSIFSILFSLSSVSSVLGLLRKLLIFFSFSLLLCVFLFSLLHLCTCFSTSSSKKSSIPVTSLHHFSGTAHFFSRHLLFLFFLSCSLVWLLFPCS
jgi:hypothetical protein